jgi:hypothetical protein
VKAVKNGEMTPEQFAIEHALDVLPGGGIAKRGVKGAEEAIKLGEKAFVKREERQLATQAEKQAVNEEKKAADGVREVERSAGCSFDAATPVTTSEGLKSIGELKTGDYVLARSDETGTYGFEPITQVFRHQDPVKVHLTLEDPATGATEVIETTPEHPFHVPGRGFVPVESLKPDDTVSRAPSNEPAASSSVVRLIPGQSTPPEVLRVAALTFENRPFLAYNLEVGEDHTFLVGAGRALVHNANLGNCGKNADELRKNLEREGRGPKAGESPGHIVASGDRRASDARELLDKYGIDINDAANGIPVGTYRPHNLMHDNWWHNYVTDQLTGVANRMRDAGYGRKAIRSALRNELRDIGRDFFR